jgi:hypothetical protein
MNAMSAVENKKLYHQSIEFLAKPLLPMDSIDKKSKLSMIIYCYWNT